MAKLIYTTLASLDGYVADEAGNFDWAAPDEEVHRFINDLERGIGTYLYGRRMYETMAVWEMPEVLPDQRDFVREYAAIWQAAEKVVYSRTLEGVSSERTRIERAFEPDAIEQFRSEADRDISVGGPELAAQAITAGLVDEYHLFLSPVVVGGGRRALPEGVHAPLELAAEHRFAGGVVHLHYRAA